VGREIFDLAGQVALVTGAASGFGRAISIGLAEFGADVAALDLNEAGLQEVCARIADLGRAALPLVADVSNRAEVERSVAAVVARFGKLDILVNNAGIGRRAPAEEMTEEQWDAVLAVDLKGVFLCAQAAGRQMLQQGHGRIINIASVAGQVGLTTGNANYSAAKGGVIALTRTLAIEWAKRGVLVNAIAPTHFHTPLVDRFIEQYPEIKRYFLDNIPLGRLGRPEEIVGPVVFLASPASSMVTGIVLNVDGGHTAR